MLLLLLLSLSLSLLLLYLCWLLLASGGGSLVAFSKKEVDSLIYLL